MRIPFSFVLALMAAVAAGPTLAQGNICTEHFDIPSFTDANIGMSEIAGKLETLYLNPVFDPTTLDTLAETYDLSAFEKLSLDMFFELLWGRIGGAMLSQREFEEAVQSQPNDLNLNKEELISDHFFDEGSERIRDFAQGMIDHFGADHYLSMQLSDVTDCFAEVLGEMAAAHNVFLQTEYYQ
jgi:hypothetical protein